MGGDANDLSGYGNDGVINGAEYVEDNCVFGGCFKFDGVDDRIVFNYFNVSDELSMFFWVYIESYVPRPSIIGQPGRFFLMIGNEGELYTWVRTNEGWHNSGLTEKYVVPLNVWKHLVITYSPDVMRYYIDGDLIYEDKDNLTTGLIPQSFGNIYIGEENGRYFKGSIDEVSIYSRELHDLEVKVLYSVRKAQLYEQILVGGVKRIDVSDCNLKHGEIYNFVGFADNQKVDQEVIIR